MRWLAHIAAVVAAVHAHHGHHHVRHHLGPVRVEPDASAYSPCSSGSVMADGHRTYWGAIASAYLPMHTLIRLRHPLHGRRYFRVRDRGGAVMRMDFWMPSCRDAVVFGRRRVAYQVVR